MPLRPVDDPVHLVTRISHLLLDSDLVRVEIHQAAREAEPARAEKSLVDASRAEHVGAEVAHERHRRQAQDTAREQNSDPRSVRERGRDQQAVGDHDELALGAQLQREVVGGRARVQRDSLTLVHHLGCCPRDRTLRLDLEADPQIEADLGVAVLQGPRPAPDPSHEPLTRQLSEVAPDRDLGYGKRLRKFRNLNVITSLEQAQHVLHPLGLRKAGEVDRVADQARLGPCLRKSIPAPLCRISRNRKQTRNRRISQTHAMDEHDVRTRLAALEIETPSWGYGNSGTRFHVYPWPGAARTVYERIADAALVHRLTGCCPSVALHIPWDAVEDYASLRRHGEKEGIRLGAINPNLFGSDEYRLGSLCNPDARVRARALEHCRECIAIAQEVGSTILSLWLADGTNYPGQDDLGSRFSRLIEGLEQLYSELPDGMTLLVEYKFFEPGFYSTDLPDWGQPRSSADVSAPGRRCWLTRGITRSGRTSSRSSRCFSRRGFWADSTSTTASTPTTT